MSIEADWLDRVVAQLSVDGPRTVSLDQIGEAIGLDWATAAQIEHLFQKLEARGFAVADESPASLAPLLARVLAAARELRTAGLAKTPSSIAERTGLTPREVRVALLYGEVLGRGR